MAVENLPKMVMLLLQINESACERTAYLESYRMPRQRHSIECLRSYYDARLVICLFGSERRINPYESLASDGIKLNMMKMEKVKIYKIK